MAWIASHTKTYRSAFPSSLVLLGRIILATFLLLVVVAPLQHLLPAYTGMIAVNGHHPIAYLLVFFFPLFLVDHRNHPTAVSRITLVAACVALILSGARGAILIIVLWLITIVVEDFRLKHHRHLALGMCAMAIALFSLVWLSLIPYEQTAAIIAHYPLNRFFLKDMPVNQERWAFIDQAVKAIRHAPVFGIGPGTFTLASRAYQTNAGQYARYAHSFPLQTLAENGVLGTISIFFLFGIVISHMVRKLKHTNKNPWEKALATSVLLTILYSTFEVTLDQLSIWLLVWASIGILIRNTLGQSSLTGPLKALQGVLLGILWLYVLSYTISSIALFSGRTTLAGMLAPYRKEIILHMIQSSVPALPLAMQSRMLFLYRKDPDILFALAKRATPENSFPLYETLLSIDPYNYAYLQAYILSRIDIHDLRGAGEAVCSLTKKGSSRASPSLCTYMQKDEFQHYLESSSFLQTLGYLSGIDGPAKFFYFVGRSLFETTGNKDATILFWTVARDGAPQWGYYHMELASAQYYWTGDQQAAHQTLIVCMSNPYARNGCALVWEDLSMLPVPGSFESDIASIPTITTQ